MIFLLILFFQKSLVECWTSSLGFGVILVVRVSRLNRRRSSNSDRNGKVSISRKTNRRNRTRAAAATMTRKNKMIFFWCFNLLDLFYFLTVILNFIWSIAACFLIAEGWVRGKLASAYPDLFHGFFNAENKWQEVCSFMTFIAPRLS